MQLLEIEAMTATLVAVALAVVVLVAVSLAIGGLPLIATTAIVLELLAMALKVEVASIYIVLTIL